MLNILAMVKVPVALMMAHAYVMLSITDLIVHVSRANQKIQNYQSLLNNSTAFTPFSYSFAIEKVKMHFLTFLAFCNAATSCSGNGACNIDDGTCDCDEFYYEIDCSSKQKQTQKSTIMKS